MQEAARAQAREQWLVRWEALRRKRDKAESRMRQMGYRESDIARQLGPPPPEVRAESTASRAARAAPHSAAQHSTARAWLRVDVR